MFRDRDTNGDGTLNERLYCLMDYFSPAAIVNLSGTVLERYTFSAFGKRRIMTADYGARTNSLCDWEFGFQGQFLDLETWNGSGEQTGLYNYGYRYYVPALGRWPSRDPIGELGGVNLNALTSNDALNTVDLLGLADGAIYPGSVWNNGATMSIPTFMGHLEEKGALPPNAKNRIRDGCIGIACYYQQDGNPKFEPAKPDYPESHDDTHCFKREPLADAWGQENCNG